MKILQFGDPKLRQFCKPLSNKSIVSKESKECAKRLIAILKGIKEISPDNGIGLAAPQIGNPIRLFVLFFDGQYKQMFNPKIIKKSQSVFDAVEECFSFYYLRAPITRFRTITVSFQDQSGNMKEKTFNDYLAALAQHELDHLDGKLYIDQIKDTKKISSIDYVLKDNPKRLKQVNLMIKYILN